VDIPDSLVKLQTAADTEHSKLDGLNCEERAAQWRNWFKAAADSQAAVTQHASEAELNRAKLEAAVKQAVRHPDPDDG